LSLMESFEGQKNKIRRDIGTRLDALEDLLTEELSRKLSQRRPKVYYKASIDMRLIVWAQEINRLPLRKSNT